MYKSHKIVFIYAQVNTYKTMCLEGHTQLQNTGNWEK